AKHCVDLVAIHAERPLLADALAHLVHERVDVDVAGAHLSPILGSRGVASRRASLRAGNQAHLDEVTGLSRETPVQTHESRSGIACEGDVESVSGRAAIA